MIPCETQPGAAHATVRMACLTCLQGRVDTHALRRRAEQRLGLPPGSAYTDATAPSLSLLRSGLFFSRHLKARPRPSNPKRALALALALALTLALALASCASSPVLAASSERPLSLAACSRPARTAGGGGGGAGGGGMAGGPWAASSLGRAPIYCVLRSSGERARALI